MTATPKRNFAFISYNHKDVKWAKWLRRELEWYRLPSEIHNEFEDSRYIRPVFRDRDELNAGVLNNELHKHLEASKFLIVICSPHSALSEWVSDEVQSFIDMGRLEYIIPFIIDGDVTSFPTALRRWNEEHKDQNLLGIAVDDDGENNKQKAFLRLVSRMLGLEFDQLWKRHERETRQRKLLLCLIMSIALILAYWFAVPIKLTVSLVDEQHKLPPLESGSLLVAGHEYHFHSLDTTITMASLPGYLRGRNLAYSVSSPSRYDSLLAGIPITFGLCQEIVIQMHRNKDFAVHSGQVLDEDALPISGVTIEIEGGITTTDAEGNYSISFPLEEQTISKQLTATHPDYQVLTLESYPTPCKFILRK